MVTSSSGIFPPLVKRMIAGVCGPCKAYNDRVVVDFKMDGNGETAQKTTSKTVQLVKAIDATQVSFPVVGPKTGLAGRRGAFIPILQSPMSAFITRKPVMHTKAQYVIEETIVNTLPLLAFTFVLLLLGAMSIWAAVSIHASCHVELISCLCIEGIYQFFLLHFFLDRSTKVRKTHFQSLFIKESSKASGGHLSQ